MCYIVGLQKWEVNSGYGGEMRKLGEEESLSSGVLRGMCGGENRRTKSEGLCWKWK